MVGNVSQQTGVGGAALKPAITALKAWLRQVNAKGGINGHPVQMIFVDDGGDSTKHLAYTKELVETRKVVAFVGNFSPLSQSQATVTYLEKVGIPVLGGDSSNAWWDKSQVLFETLTGTKASQAYNELLLLKRHAGTRKRFFVASCREAAACPVVRDAMKKYAPATGWEWAGSADISITQLDFTSECLDMRSKRVDAITVLADASTVVRFERSCARQGIHPLYLGSLGGLGYSFATDTSSPEEVVSTMIPWIGASVTADYEKAVRSAGGNPEPYGIYAWTAAKLFEKVASRAPGGRSPTTADLFNALWSLRNETLGGLTRLTYRKGNIHDPASCLAVTLAKNRKWSSPENGRVHCNAAPS